MPTYLIRQNCEYTLLIEADSEQEAYDIARSTDLDDWDTAWSDLETDEDEVTASA